MGLRCTVDPVADLNYPSATPSLGLYIDYSNGCDAFLDTFFNIVYDLCPVDTGELISSIDGSTDGESVEVLADADYAQYVEYGTFKMEAQPYFRPALAAALATANQDWQNAVDEAMEEEAQIRAESEESEESEEEDEEDEEGEEGDGGGTIGLLGRSLGLSGNSFWGQMAGIMAGFGYVWAGGGLMGIIGGAVLGIATAFFGGFCMFLSDEMSERNRENEANTKRGKSHSAGRYSGDYSDLHIEIY